MTFNPVTDDTTDRIELDIDGTGLPDILNPAGIAVLDISATPGQVLIPFSVLGWSIGASDYDGYDYFVFHFPGERGVETIDVTATSQGLVLSVDSFSPFLFYFTQKAADPSPGPSWDEEETLPPFIPAEDSDDDTVTIVACAAAAVVAALMAVFLVLTYRKD